MPNKFVKKIFKNNDKYTIFWTKDCPFSEKAIALLKKKKLNYKSYTIEKIEGIHGNIRKLASYFLEEPSLNYNPNHLTRPIIFKDCKFIGGYVDLKKYLEKNNI